MALAIKANQRTSLPHFSNKPSNRNSIERGYHVSDAKYFAPRILDALERFTERKKRIPYGKSS